MTIRSAAPRIPRSRAGAPGGATADASVGVAVDVVPFALRGDELAVALVEVRGGGEPSFAFPGGRVRVAESLDAAARRWLEQALPGESAHLEQLYTFGEPARDPAARVVSVAYLAFLARAAETPAARWFPVSALPKLAYDHTTVARVALDRLRAKLAYTNIAYSLLPPSFTLAELQSAYAAILGRPLDRRNFRKRMLALGFLEPLSAARRGRHRPAQLYRFAQRRPVTIGVLSERVAPRRAS